METYITDVESDITEVNVPLRIDVDNLHNLKNLLSISKQ